MSLRPVDIDELLETRECENPKCCATFRVLPTDMQMYCGQQCSFERRKVKKAGDRYRQLIKCPREFRVQEA